MSAICCFHGGRSANGSGMSAISGASSIHAGSATPMQSGSEPRPCRRTAGPCRARVPGRGRQREQRRCDGIVARHAAPDGIHPAEAVLGVGVAFARRFAVERRRLERGPSGRLRHARRHAPADAVRQAFVRRTLSPVPRRSPAARAQAINAAERLTRPRGHASSPERRAHCQRRNGASYHGNAARKPVRRSCVGS